MPPCTAIFSDNFVRVLSDGEPAAHSANISRCKEPAGGTCMVVVSLANIVEALDLQSDELHSYLDPDSGEIITFNDEEAQFAERDNWDSAPQWMQQLLPKIKRALAEDRMLELPDRVRIDEWRMMQDFAGEDAHCHCRAELMAASHGPLPSGDSKTRSAGSGWSRTGTVFATQPTSAWRESGSKKTIFLTSPDSAGDTIPTAIQIYR